MGARQPGVHRRPCGSPPHRWPLHAGYVSLPASPMQRLAQRGASDLILIRARVTVSISRVFRAPGCSVPHFRFSVARFAGLADRTPKVLASYEAAQTTERLPFQAPLTSHCSTEV